MGKINKSQKACRLITRVSVKKYMRTEGKKRTKLINIKEGENNGEEGDIKEGKVREGRWGGRRRGTFRHSRLTHLTSRLANITWHPSAPRQPHASLASPRHS